MFLISGGVSAFLSFILNKIFVKKFGNNAIYSIVPIVEEASKTLVAFLFLANIFYAHIVFGVIEAIYDGLTSSKQIALAAALMSLITHGILGIIAYYTFSFTRNIVLAIIIPWVFHMAWNYFILRYEE